MTAAAFFDFDQTLLEVESAHMGIRMLRDRKMLPAGYFFKIYIANIFYRWQFLSETGNHPADIPMLEAAGHPRAVEPTPALARIAAGRGWPVLSFR